MAVNLSKQLARARQYDKNSQPEKARLAYASMYNVAPTNVPLAVEYAGLLERMERWSDFTAVYEGLCKKLPGNQKLRVQLAQIYLRLNQLPRVAELIAQIEQVFGDSEALLLLKYNLAAASGQRQEALNFALACVKRNPSSPTVYNNLGAAFCDLGMREQGGVAFENALLLDQKNIAALTNLGYVATYNGEHDKAIELYEQALALVGAGGSGHTAESIQFPLSFQYLARGELNKGWEYYDAGFHLSLKASGRRTPGRLFGVPRWQGQPLDGKRLLVWREQGLGDELRFASCIPDLVNAGGPIIIECDPRLVQIFANSFTFATVRAAQWDLKTNGPINTDYDFEVPMGSLMRHLRKNIDDFTPVKAYLFASERDRLEVRQAFEQLPKGLNIGICWRSGNLNPTRNVNYTNLADWAEILQLAGCNFINLQYGNSEEELLAAEKALNITIHRWPDLDLKNDLSGVFAVMSELDLVISVGTAVAAMAPAVGTRTWEMIPNRHWMQLGRDDWVWSSSCEIIRSENVQGVVGLLPKIKSRLKGMTAKN